MPVMRHHLLRADMRLSTCKIHITAVKDGDGDICSPKESPCIPWENLRSSPCIARGADGRHQT